MKFNSFMLSAALGCFASFQLAAAKPANSFDLEWSCKNDTSLPYEIAIDRAKLDKLAGIPQNADIQVVAVTANGDKQVDTKIIKGNASGKDILRLTVPAGTKKLYAVVKNSDKKFVCINSTDNLFDGALKNPSKWTKNRSSINISSDGNKIIIKANEFGWSTAKYFVDLPAGYAGTPAALELELKSLAKLTWGGAVRVEQYDAKGKLLPESLTEPRWISHMRVPGVTTHYQEYGFFHKDAKRIAVTFDCSGTLYKYDNHGLEVKQKSDCLPELEISKLAVRKAQQLPFPSYNDKLFAQGVTGKEGDHALKLDGNTIFHYSPNSHAVYSEGKQIKSDKECFWPLNDGTVELWINPQWKRSDAQTFCVIDARNNYGPRPKNKAIRQKIGSLFNTTYTPKRGVWKISVLDGSGKRRDFTFKHKLELKKWSHIAVQYGKNGIECFVNGKKVFANSKFSFVKHSISKEFYHNDQIAQVVAIGNDANRARQIATKYAPATVDSLRISGGRRYTKEFSPEKELKADAATYALFDFDRSIDGKSSMGLGKVYGSINSSTFLRARTFAYDGKTIQYFPEKLLDGSNPEKVLNKNNYPVMPSVKDFKAARKDNTVKYSATPGSRKELNIPANSYMNYIEIACPDNVAELRHPVLIANEELDVRSFGDITDSLKNIKVSDYEKANLLFNLVLKASDYFMTHQASIGAHSDRARHASYLALSLFNGYCGFECGPLNNMAANMFSCSGSLPATQTAGYGHSFQQVYFDGKNHVYDLSAQQFFPGWDNETPASLKELDVENGAFARWGRGSSSFTRQGFTRGYARHIPGMQQRIAYTLHPGEKARFYFYNDGNYNDVQVARCIDPRAVHPNDPFPYDKKFRLAEKAPKELVCTEQLYQVHRPFPHYSNAYFSFSGKPSKSNKAFSNVTANDFIYAVELPYPIVAGRYEAITSDGKKADIELSTDGGKTFRKLVTDADGRATYAIRARHAYYIKIKAPISKVTKFEAFTEVMFNSRVQNCQLKTGENSILFKADKGSKADITVSYRNDVKELVIKDAPYNGAIPGFERQITAVEPGKSVSHAVEGASAEAKVTSSSGVTAKLANGVLSITAKADSSATRFENVVIDDNGAKKELAVLVAPNVRLIPAKNAVPLNGAKIVPAHKNCVQDCLVVNKGGQRATFNFEEIPAGDYTIWLLSRMNTRDAKARSSRDGTKQDIGVVLPDGKIVPAITGINSGTEFYKAQYGKGKGRFRWDARLDNDHNKYPYFSPRWTTLDNATQSVTIQANRPHEIEIAAMLITPRTDKVTRSELVKILCGLNCEPWKVASHQSK